MYRGNREYIFGLAVYFPVRHGNYWRGSGFRLRTDIFCYHSSFAFCEKKGQLRIQPFKIDFSLIKKICKRGIPEAVSQLTTPVTALCYNLMLAGLTGDIGVSAYSVLSFIYSLANAVLSGVAQGLQPLWGNCYGKQDTNGMNWFSAAVSWSI